MRSAVLALALSLVACAQRGAPIDPGVRSGASYENAGFDLRVVPPPGWELLAPDEIERAVSAASPAMPSALRRAKANAAKTTALFGMVDRAHAPAPGRARRAVLAQAQRVPSPPEGLTSETIATELADGLAEVEPPIQIGARRQAIVGGRRFVVVPTIATQGGITGRLDHYVRYEPFRLLVLTVSYPPEETAPPQDAIESIGPLVPAALKGAP